MSAADDEALAVAVEATTADALDALGKADAPAADDPQQQPTRRRRRTTSGTSRAERKAKAEAAGEPKAPRARAIRTRPRRVDIAQSMAQLYTLAGVGVSMAPPLDPDIRQAVGLALAEQAEACGQAWAALAKENDRVRQALESLLTVSSVGVLVSAHVPIVLAGVQAAAARPVVVAEFTAA